MPIQNYGRVMQDAAEFAAMPYNALVDAREREQVNARRNALVEQDTARFARQEKQWASEDEEEAAWDAAVQARNLDAMYAIDPQTAKTLHQYWKPEDFAKPEQQAEPRLYSTAQGFLPADQAVGKMPYQAPLRTGGGSGGASKPTYRTLTPEEIAQAGLPAGTVAQVGDSGKLDVVSEPAKQTLTPKDASMARVKLSQIANAKQQLALVKRRYAEIEGSYSSGLGGGFVPTVKGKAADAAVNSMRDTLTAITRVPGVGAMSDFETRLAMAKFPDRGQYEEVSKQQIQSIEDLLLGLEQGYQALLEGDTPQAPTVPTAPQDALTPEEQAELEALRKRFGGR